MRLQTLAKSFLLFASHAVLLTSVSGKAIPDNVKPIFLFKDVMQSNTYALKTSGFDSVILFRIGILATGDLVYYSTGGAGEAVSPPVVTDGVYVGGSALAEKVRSFKKGETGINRVEVSSVSNDDTFINVRSLVNSTGIGPHTALYRNFKALKEAWDLDAWNNDDETQYDLSSHILFARMLGNIGYKYSSAPYTNTSFWLALKNALDVAAPGLYDRVYLQVYDGGQDNDPGEWQQTLGMKIIPLVWVTNDDKPQDGTTPAEALVKFGKWYSEEKVGGGGYWNDYDIEKMNSSYTAYGDVLGCVFGKSSRREKEVCKQLT